MATKVDGPQGGPPQKADVTSAPTIGEWGGRAASIAPKMPAKWGEIPGKIRAFLGRPIEFLQKKIAQRLGTVSQKDAERQSNPEVRENSFQRLVHLAEEKGNATTVLHDHGRILHFKAERGGSGSGVTVKQQDVFSTPNNPLWGEVFVNPEGKYMVRQMGNPTSVETEIGLSQEELTKLLERADGGQKSTLVVPSPMGNFFVTAYKDQEGKLTLTALSVKIGQTNVVQTLRVMKKLLASSQKTLEDLLLQAAEKGMAKVLICDEKGELKQLTLVRDPHSDKITMDLLDPSVEYPDAAKAAEAASVVKKLKESPKKALNQLFLQAAEKGEAKVLIRDEQGKLKQLTVTKDPDSGGFKVGLKDAQLGRFLQEEKVLEGGLAPTIFDGLSQQLLDTAFAQQGKKRVFMDSGAIGGHVALQLRVRDDGVVVVKSGQMLGEGSFKMVQKVHKFGARREVYAQGVLKRQTADTRQMLAKEHSSLQQFSHPNIVKARKMKQRSMPIWDMDKQQFVVQEQVALQTEFCDKGTCEELEQKATTSDEWRDRSSAIMDAAAGLKHIHEKGMAVMDFKPANLFRKTENGRVVTKLGDLDPKKVGEGDSTMTRGFADLDAMKDGKASTKSDVWALGVSIYNMAYGFQDNPVSFVQSYEHMEQQIPLLMKKLQGDTDPGHRKLNALLLKMFSARETRPDLTDAFMGEMQMSLASFVP